ncbi:hypothetical protein L596_017203 [Steinernema carpocapsae]|uniref:Secreted protein n=1 Tax=Steinernema carpocapsae TaxID=34508 RepID=A0A4U5N0Z2_STECR|nr:hypothetical protein L596_017203 [Steinernema carpocapsae]
MFILLLHLVRVTPAHVKINMTPQSPRTLFQTSKSIYRRARASRAPRNGVEFQFLCSPGFAPMLGDRQHFFVVYGCAPTILAFADRRLSPLPSADYSPPLAVLGSTVPKRLKGRVFVGWLFLELQLL